MMCYKDMTFCADHATCKHGAGCFRALTDDVVAGAHAWWGDCDGEPPICRFGVRPNCWEALDNNE